MALKCRTDWKNYQVSVTSMQLLTSVPWQCLYTCISRKLETLHVAYTLVLYIFIFYLLYFTHNIHILSNVSFVDWQCWSMFHSCSQLSVLFLLLIWRKTSWWEMEYRNKDPAFGNISFCAADEGCNWRIALLVLDMAVITEPFSNFKRGLETDETCFTGTGICPYVGLSCLQWLYCRNL